MILPDTSVWIDLVNARPVRRLREDDLLGFVTCGPVLQEVLQGLRVDPQSEIFREAFLAIPRVGDPLGTETFLEAAEIYRQGRRRGYTIRSSTDCLIAVIAMQNRVTVWHHDRDFRLISRYTNLEAIERF